MAGHIPNTNPSQGNSPKLLRTHLEEMQHAVYVAESLLSVIVACGGSPKFTTLSFQALTDAAGVLEELGQGLDRVELDKLVTP